MGKIEKLFILLVNHEPVGVFLDKQEANTAKEEHELESQQAWSENEQMEGEYYDEYAPYICVVEAILTTEKIRGLLMNKPINYPTWLIDEGKAIKINEGGEILQVMDLP